ncbi:beta-lactamase-like protein [Aspergillus undulatus]|uniref:beta-lactamase-like protein n=1 Tax=Aspergillus undulatus TaxID=1810928 RepID=UPI003CCE4D61
MSPPSFNDTRDYDADSRGFIAALKLGIIKHASGRIRQGQLNSKHPLYEICPGIYQVRGYDLSNMTIVEGKEGIIVIDPLASCECAATGLELYQANRGHGKINVPTIAPQGFMEAILSESILAGPAMRRRGAFMYGNALPRSPEGPMGIGLGMDSSVRTTSLMSPTNLIQDTGEKHIIDGMTIVFQNGARDRSTRGDQLSLPGFSGAMYSRDGDKLHNWPTWGQEELMARLEEQRDLYGYKHDQTVRMMNLDMTCTEIAEQMQLPPVLERAWYCRGFYGSLSHNVKYPPREEGQRYVECFGGVDGLCDKAENFIERGDHRFAATPLAHAAAADPDNLNPRARNLLATTVDQFFEILSVQLNSEQAAEASFSIDLHVTDIAEKWRLILSNGVLTRRRRDSQAYLEDAQENSADLQLALTKQQLLVVAQQTGKREVLDQWIGMVLVDEQSSRNPSQM